MSKQYLFICGCPRSGTSALCDLVNSHPDICIGMERYYNKILIDGELNPAMFDLPRFLDYQSGDSFHPELNQGDILKNKYKHAIYVGEKLPKLYSRLNLLAQNFPVVSVKILFIFREIFGVAESYTARAKNINDNYWERQQDWRIAVQDWNDSIAAYINYKSYLAILPVDYEALFCSDVVEGEAQLRKIINFLGVDAYSSEEMDLIRLRFFGRTETRGNRGIHTQEETAIIEEKADIDKWHSIFS